MQRDQQLRAVLVGVSRPHDWPASMDLGGAAERDVASFAELIKSEFGGADVVQLVGSSATKENVRQAIEETLTRSSTAGDIAVFYFAGHGIKEGRADVRFAVFDTAWLTDTNKVNPLIRNTLFSIPDLVGAFGTLSAGARIEAIFDMCFAGGAIHGWRILSSISRLHTDALVSLLRRLRVKNPFALASQIERALRGRRYVLWLSSSPDTESHQVQATDGSRGAFTVALESALRATGSGTRAQTLREVRASLAKAKQNPRLAPSPEELRERSIFDFGR